MLLPKFKNGFTLIELLVVISIISLLTSLSFSYLGDARQKGRDTAKIQAMNETRKALQIYATENGSFPESISALVPNYIKSVSPDINYEGINPNGDVCTSSSCSSYHISTKLERNDNKVLKNDSNTTVSSDCVNRNQFGSSSNDYCYDFRP